MFKVILACTDLTPLSDDALRDAFQLAKINHASVVALHVVPLPTELRHWSAPLFNEDMKTYREFVARQLASARQALGRQLAALGVPASETAAELTVRSGVPAEVIAATADELGVDLIVIARGRGGKLGSTTEHVVRLAGRTVLVAPARAKAAVATGATPVA
jgi:nucleotide-binding universal stress UspA family protein